MNKKTFLRAVEITKTIGELDRYINCQTRQDKLEEVYKKHSRADQLLISSDGGISFLSFPEEYREQYKEELTYAHERIINKMIKDRNALQKELEEL